MCILDEIGWAKQYGKVFSLRYYLLSWEKAEGMCHVYDETCPREVLTYALSLHNCIGIWPKWRNVSIRELGEKRQIWLYKFSEQRDGKLG